MMIATCCCYGDSWPEIFCFKLNLCVNLPTLHCQQTMLHSLYCLYFYEMLWVCFVYFYNFSCQKLRFLQPILSKKDIQANTIIVDIVVLIVKSGWFRCLNSANWGGVHRHFLKSFEKGWLYEYRFMNLIQ